MGFLDQYFSTVLSVFAGSTALHIFYKCLAAIAGALIAWFILNRIILQVEKKLSRLPAVNIDPRLFAVIRKALVYVLIFITGSYVVGLLHIELLEKIFYAALIMLLAISVAEFLAIIITYLKDNVADKTETKLDDIIFNLINKFAGVIIYATAGVLALDTLGLNIMPFIAGAGVAGVAIGFASKDTLSNLIAGVLLIIDRPFEKGDRIEVWSAPKGSSTWGDVIEIGLRATKIKTTDNIVIIIPNNDIMTRDIVNYTTYSQKIRVRINIGVSYDTDIAKAKEVIIKVAGSAGWIEAYPAPKVVVRSFGESSINLQLRVWIADARRRMDTISYITDTVKTAFDEAGIQIPFPRREITIISGEKKPDTKPAGEKNESAQ
jgi:MscS family membrane protein